MKATISLAMGLLILVGCTRVQRSFPGQDPDHVWTAIVAVAETPDYHAEDPDDRWHVRQNEVWIDPVSDRLEIYRELDRILFRAHTRPLRQQRTWRFQILFDREDPPRVTFVSRGAGVPTHAQEEADRFFADVWDILEGGAEDEPGALEPAVPTAPTTRPDRAPDRPMVDPADMEPR